MGRSYKGPYGWLLTNLSWFDSTPSRQVSPGQTCHVLTAIASGQNNFTPSRAKPLRVPEISAGWGELQNANTAGWRPQLIKGQP